MKTEQKRKKNYVTMSPRFYVEKGTKTVVCEMSCCLQLGKVTTIAPQTIHNAMAKKLPYVKAMKVTRGNEVFVVGGCFTVVARAMCNPTDTFNFKVGSRIAESRAKAKAYKKARKAWAVAAQYIAQEAAKITHVIDNCDLVAEVEDNHIADLVK